MHKSTTWSHSCSSLWMSGGCFYWLCHYCPVHCYIQCITILKNVFMISPTSFSYLPSKQKLLRTLYGRKHFSGAPHTFYIHTCQLLHLQFLLYLPPDDLCLGSLFQLIQWYVCTSSSLFNKPTQTLAFILTCDCHSTTTN